MLMGATHETLRNRRLGHTRKAHFARLKSPDENCTDRSEKDQQRRKVFALKVSRQLGVGRRHCSPRRSTSGAERRSDNYSQPRRQDGVCDFSPLPYKPRTNCREKGYILYIVKQKSFLSLIRGWPRKMGFVRRRANLGPPSRARIAEERGF